MFDGKHVLRRSRLNSFLLLLLLGVFALTSALKRIRCAPSRLERELVSDSACKDATCISSEAYRSNPPVLISAWHSLMKETRKMSTECTEFMLFSVTVSSSRTESHHTKRSIPSPNTTTSMCAILLHMEIVDHDTILGVQLEEKDGWVTLKTSANLPGIFARRASRIPKILPDLFFPSTNIVLYCDLKRLQDIQKIDAFILASRLLAGTQFGIVQHPRSKNVVAERDAILSFRSGSRPLILDNIDLLSAQVDMLSLKLSATQQHAYAVEGELSARIINNASSAALFNSLWYEEYASGCDRDQISFFGAAARMNLQRISAFACPFANRSGIYSSSSKTDFFLAIHCQLEEVISP
jgi:hypothetical protein